MPIKIPEREYRDFNIDIVRDQPDDEKRVTGYATTFNNPYVLYSDESWELREMIDSHALEDTDLTDVIMQYNHEGRVFARVSNGSLLLGVDTKGLVIDADLGGTEIGRDLYEEIAGGYTNKMSIGMKVDTSRDVWATEEIAGKTVETRTINRISKVYDVSAVSIPANDATSISVRELTNGVISKLKAERLDAKRLEVARKLLEIRIKGV